MSERTGACPKLTWTEWSQAPICVAFSGGPDSTALLYGLAQVPEVRACGLRALHVDHGLHADSANWAKHCAAFCESLELPLTTLRVKVDDTRHEGIEAAARRARYAAFAANLGDGEWLALAHHQDDQVETVLLKLLRGAGPEGLGGMRTLRPFARGFLWRPLLETSRTTLHNYLIKNSLQAINDPANANPRFARNQLRQTVLPHIREHWPHADAGILHAARLCAAAAGYINDAADAALATLQREAGSLDATGWLALPDALRAPVLDAWLHAHALSAPRDAARHELEHQATCAAHDRVPVVAWPGAEVRVWDGCLHATSPFPMPPARWQSAWDGASLELPAGCGTLTLVTHDGSPLQDTCFESTLTVQLRGGGERIQPTNDSHARTLSELFRQAHVPPWLRMRCPLIYLGDELIAVADLWRNERGKAMFQALGAQPHWIRHA